MSSGARAAEEWGANSQRVFVHSRGGKKVVCVLCYGVGYICGYCRYVCVSGYVVYIKKGKEKGDQKTEAKNCACACDERWGRTDFGEAIGRSLGGVKKTSGIKPKYVICREGKNGFDARIEELMDGRYW